MQKKDKKCIFYENYSVLFFYLQIWYLKFKRLCV